MRTNIVLEDRLVKEALRHSGIKIKKELIHKALEEFFKNRWRRNLLDLAGKIKFAEGYDYKSLRTGKSK
jgi:Arc/MetJ family transcription regulator